MQKIIRIFSVLYIMAAASQGVADVATNMTTLDNNRFRLFWVDGSDVVHAACTPDAVTFDHNTCQEDVRRVEESALFGVMAAHFGAALPKLGDTLSGLYLDIERVDAKLLEELSVTPGAGSQALQDKMTADVTAAAVQDAEIKDLDDQIARVTAELAAHPSQDLQVQQRALGAQRVRMQQASIGLHDALAQARLAWITANATSLDQQTFSALTAQRAVWVRQIAATMGSINEQQAERADLYKLYTRLEESGFVYEHRYNNVIYADTQPIVEGTEQGYEFGLDSSFNGIDLQLRTFAGATGTDLNRVNLAVTLAQPISFVQCAFTTQQDPAAPVCFLQMTVSGPNGFSAVLSGDLFAYAVGTEQGAISESLTKVIGWPGLGSWSVVLSCANAAAMATGSQGGTCRFQAGERVPGS